MKLLEAVKSSEIFKPVSGDEAKKRLIDKVKKYIDDGTFDSALKAEKSVCNKIKNDDHSLAPKGTNWIFTAIEGNVQLDVILHDSSAVVYMSTNDADDHLHTIRYVDHKSTENDTKEAILKHGVFGLGKAGYKTAERGHSWFFDGYVQWKNNIKESRIDELTIPQLNDRNKSVYNRFSDRDEKVDAVAAAGGIRWKDWTPNTWRYVVKSASLADVWYDVYVRFDDIEDIVKNSASIDYRELAKAVLSGSNVRTVCSCPADLYFHQYNRTKENSKYTTPEKRPANITNPAGDGIRCKHQDLVFKQLPFYTTKMAAHIKHFFPKGGDGEQPKEEPKPDQPQPVAQGVKPAAEPVKSKERPGVASIIKDPKIDAIIQKAFDKRTPNKIGDQSQIKK